MKYQGGKHRIAKDIAKIIHQQAPEKTIYLEPFLGGGGAFQQISVPYQTVFAGDSQLDLVLMWQDIANGWIPPIDVSKDDYHTIKHDEPSSLRGFVGYGCSFSGKWFNGFANPQPKRNYAKESRDSLVKISKLMPPNKHGSILYRSFDEWKVTSDFVVYCDPPYAGTMGYETSFDHAHFWNTAEAWVNIGAKVFVSEYSAPEGWTCLYEKEQALQMSGGSHHLRPLRTERLFTL